MTAPSARDLNRLVDAALAFGANWRRPVPDLAGEHLPDLPREDLDALVSAVEGSRSAIEAHVAATHLRLAGRWSNDEERAADVWIAERFPWLTRENRRRALSQSQYYAWHDHG